MEEISGAKPASFDAQLELLSKLGLHESAREGMPRAVANEQPPENPSPVLTVAPAGAADYPSIQAALRSARKGARIMVRPGKYEETIVLTKELEIIGDGPCADIIFENMDAHCLVMQSRQALVRGLTLRSRGAFKGTQRFAVDIPYGRLVLEDCDVSSDTLAAVAAHGASAEAIIRRCRIHDGNTSGIVFWDKGRGTVEECEISGNAVAGVLIRTQANPVIRRCEIHHGKMFGIMAEEQGRGTIEECAIFENRVAGVEFLSQANPVLRGSKIHNGEKVGV